MKKCPKCKTKFDKSDIYCPNCGYETGKFKRELKTIFFDFDNLLWVLLGYLVPMGGLLLLGLWYHKKPVTAKAAGLGAIARVVLTLLLPFVLFSIFVIAVGIMKEIANLL